MISCGLCLLGSIISRLELGFSFSLILSRSDEDLVARINAPFGLLY